MKKQIVSALVGLMATTAILAVASTTASTAASAELAPWSASSIIRDPEWQKSFLGSYGFLSGVEPEIKASELEILREIIDLMKVNPRAASTMLAQRVEPQSSAALDFILANLRFQNGDTANAVVSYEQALTKFPDFRRARKNLGLLMVQMGEYEGAIEQLTRAIELGDRDGRTYGLLGYCYLNQENPVAAEQAYRTAVLQQPNSNDWQLGLARALLAQQRYEESISLFSTFLERNPLDARVWKLQANAFIGIEKPRAAAVNFETVRILDQADASTLILLGDIYMNDGIHDLARDAYLEAIAKDKGGAAFEPAYRAAELLLRTKAYEACTEVVASIDQQYRSRMTGQQTLELMTLKAKLARGQGRNKEAAAMLEEIVARDGTRGDAILELARFHRDQGDEQKALLLLERAENLEAFEYQALIEHGQFKVASQDYEEAAQLLRRALRIKKEPRVERFLARVDEAIRR